METTVCSLLHHCKFCSLPPPILFFVLRSVNTMVRNESHNMIYRNLAERIGINRADYNDKESEIEMVPCFWLELENIYKFHFSQARIINNLRNKVRCTWLSLFPS
eukprot:TRINITY_DN7063_c2_g1_i1.p1 TRINITY_DN7063_c2_g1~~TRINITY_DN7063_c2_g1_i1.p1  ORF type:complete len:105 (-),score=11.00 TRINITY_DN7063_c2_g1_i1:465-779(-)